jgi:hypothetical protein
MTGTNISCAASAKRNRAIFLIAGFALLSVSAQAAPRDDVKAGVSRCDGISDDRAWLDCFYGAAQPMRSRLGLAPAPEFQTRSMPPPVSGATPQPEAPAGSSHGDLLSDLMGGGDDVAPRQHLTAYSFDHAGLFTVTLADGSIWQQLPNDGIRASWRGAANSYVVTVSQGALGGTSLIVAGTGTHYRVKRLR